MLKPNLFNKLVMVFSVVKLRLLLAAKNRQQNFENICKD